MRALLMWGLGGSLALHALLGPIVGTYRTPVTDAPEISVVSLSQRATVKLPTPAPTPRPTPPPTPPPEPITPPPVLTPPPAPVRAPPPQAHLRINVLKTISKPKPAGPSEPKYPDRPGSQQGVPQGTLASAPAVAPQSGTDAGAGAPSAVPPTPLRTPTPPACAVPNADAKATQEAQPVYPESAQQLGISGAVDVLVSLAADGGVTAATIYKSSGSAALDQAAIRAARASTYSPDIVNCQAIAGSYTFHVSFQRL
jgi:protein TonB